MGLRSVLFATGFTLLGAYAAVQADALLFNERESARLRSRLPSLPVVRPASRSVTAGAPGAPGARAEARRARCWGRLEIPRVGLSVLLGEGTDELTLLRVAGHVRGTSFPGERGNVAIAGHRDGVFRPLRDVLPGDRIRVDTPDGLFTYVVEATQVVTPARVDVLAPTADNALTLVTCYPFSYIGPAPQRFIVRAREAPDQG